MVKGEDRRQVRFTISIIMGTLEGEAEAQSIGEGVRDKGLF